MTQQQLPSYIQVYKLNGYTQTDLNSNDFDTAIKAHREVGFTQQSTQNQFEDIRFEAYEKLGYTKKAILDSSTLIAFQAHDYFKRISFILRKGQICYSVKQQEADYLREEFGIPVNEAIIEENQQQEEK